MDLRRAWPLVVVVCALTVRLWGIDWQLPAALYFDEMKYVGWAGVAKADVGAVVEDLRNPTLYHHMLQAEYALASLARRGASVQETAVFELWLARVTSAVLGSLACLLTALAMSGLLRTVGGLRFGPRRPGDGASRDAAWAGFAAGLVLALAPLHVHLSHYAVNDATASFFLAATLFFGCRALGSGSWRDLLLAGAAAGLAFSTKYNFAIGLVLPLLVALLVRRHEPTPSAGTGRAPQATPLPDLSTDGDRAPQATPLPVGVGLAPPFDAVPATDATPATAEVIRRARLILVVLGGFVLGGVLGAPELVLRPGDVFAGVTEQVRLGSVRWNGQSDAPVWQLYAETLIQGLGWPALLAGAIGAAVLGWRSWRSWRALAILLGVPLLCLGVMLRQELFFARFALPLLPPLAMLAGIGVVGLTRLGLPIARGQSAGRAAMEAAVVLLVLGVVVMPEVPATVRHNQLATTTDTRVLARRWLRQRGDGARVASEIYGQPLAWTGSEATRGFRLNRVPSFADPALVTRLACDGHRDFLVVSLTAERELARRSVSGQESGYDILARRGRVVTTFDPFWPGTSAPAHPDNTGIPFWYLEAYARPGPKITVYELPEGAVACGR